MHYRRHTEVLIHQDNAQIDGLIFIYVHSIQINIHTEHMQDFTMQYIIQMHRIHLMGTKKKNTIIIYNFHVNTFLYDHKIKIKS